MRNRLTDFLRQTTNAIHASKLRDRRTQRDREARARDASEKAAADFARERPTSRPLVVEGVAIEYSPSMDGDPDPGEVVWAWVTYEDDPSQGKDRPVVVIGRRGARDLVGVALTSKRDERDPQVPVGTGSWDREGRPSYAKIDRLIALDAGAVRREGAVLGRDRFDAVIDGLRLLHDG